MFTHPDSSPFVIGSEFQILPPCSMRKMNHCGQEKNLVSRRAGVLEVKLGLLIEGTLTELIDQ